MPTPLAVGLEPMENDERTRDRIAHEVLRQGPVTVAALADQLALTPAGVRRHLDHLQAAGLVTTWQGAASRQRARGRPARQYVLSDAGHAAMTSGYGDLAVSALRHLARIGGAGAVRTFAEERIGELERRHRPAVEAAGDSPGVRARALAEALSREGYAASTRPVPGGRASQDPGREAAQAGGHGLQLCQGHCPVQDVAREFPQLCEAETDAFSRLLGVHVQRLATLAHGEHVCTTYVPPTGTTRPSTERQSR